MSFESIVGVIVTVALGGVNLGFILKLMYNHLHHIREDIKELRQVIYDHLRDHRG